MRRLHRLNQEIRVPEVRVVDSEGELVGVMSVSQALEKAHEQGVDLVEISPKAVPPVCKLINYGKMLYALQKKEQKAKQTGKAKEIKGLRLTFAMGEGDQDRQRRKAEEFLREGHTVRIQMVMKGREKAHGDLAVEKIRKFIEGLGDLGKVEVPPKFSGYQIITLIKPNH